MDGQWVIVEFLGISWTIPLVFTAIGGGIGALGTLYKIHERWTTREQRHLDMLHEFLDKEEKNISARRREILTSISLSQHSYLTDRKLDVGAEIDETVGLLDEGRPDRAEARLKELLKKLQSNSKILERRVEDLKKHERSVNIFLAAVADGEGQTDNGLSYIADALIDDSRDLDALKYKGILLLKNRELDTAWQTFDRLRQISTRNPVDKAEAHFGLGCVAMERGIEHYEEAAKALGNALVNLNGLPPNQQSPLTKVGIHQKLAQIYATKDWSQSSTDLAKDHFRKALKALETLSSKKRNVSDRHRQLSASLWLLEHPEVL